MSDEHPVRASIIGTTVGGVLLAAILWAVGYAGVVWRGIVWALSAVWTAVTTTIPVPLGVLALGISLSAVVMVLALRRRDFGTENRESVSPVGPKERLASPDTQAVAIDPRELSRVLDQLQKRVMIALADWDGDTPTIAELAEDLNAKRLRVEQAVERLEAVGLVSIVDDSSGESVIEVTRAGRDYLIAKRHV